MLRWIIGLPLAGLITALLFLVMAYLIRQDFEPSEQTPPPVITITTKLTDSDLDEATSKDPREKLPPRTAAA